MKRILLLLTLATLSVAAFSQDNMEKEEKDVTSMQPNNWAVSLNGGTAQFYGDIASNMFYYPTLPKEGDLSFSVFASAEKHFSPFYGLRVRAGYASLSTIEDAQDPRLSETDLIDIHLENKISLSNIFFPEMYQKNWSSYLLVGYGIPFYRTQVKDEAGNIINSEGYSDNGETKESRETTGSVSVGLGVRVKLSQNFAISAEANIENTKTDRLDAINKGLSELDKYGYTSLGVVYTFGENDKQVPMEYNPTPEEDIAMQEKVDSLEQKLKDLDDKVEDVNKNVEKIAERYEGPDSDNDGIADSYDKEPNTESGAVVNHNGVAVNDYSKEEIEEMTSAAEPEVKTGVSPNTEVAFKSIYFGLNSSSVTADNMKKITNVAQLMKKNKDVKLKIVGSAGKLGSKEYNKNLSEKRAKTVKEKLTNNFGIKPNRLKVDFVGEEKPVADEPLYINRRADLYIKK